MSQTSPYSTFGENNRQATSQGAENYERYVLFVGKNGRELSKGLVAQGFSGLGIDGAFKAFQWMESRKRLDPKSLPEAIICDEALAEGSVLQLLHSVRSMPLLRLIPFILIGEQDTQASRFAAQQLGADDFYPTTVDARRLIDRINFLKSFNKLRPQLDAPYQDEEFVIPRSKRIFDMLMAGSLLLLLSPLLLLVALLIKLESSGPVFYVSRRAGSGFRVFDFFKFRTMHLQAENDLPNLMHLNVYATDGASLLMERQPEGSWWFFEGRKQEDTDLFQQAPGAGGSPFVKIADDPRVTFFGRFLRCTSIDELPQLFNVLTGDMSMVGNRPLPLYEAEQLTTDQWSKRFLAPAGITGLWQVARVGRNNISAEERKQLDISYAEKMSFGTDLVIMIKTLPALFQKD